MVPGTDVFDILLQQGPQGRHERHADVAGDRKHEPRGCRRRPGGAQHGGDHKALRRRKRRSARDHVHPCGTGEYPGIRALLRAVYGADNGTTSISNTSISYSGGAITVQPVETSGSAAHAAIVTLPTPLVVNDILLGQKSISAATLAGTGQIWSNRSIQLRSTIHQTSLRPRRVTIRATRGQRHIRIQTPTGTFLPA